jgi:hypothetical protein
LTVICDPVSASAHMRRRSWSPTCRLYPVVDWAAQGGPAGVLHGVQQGAGCRRPSSRLGPARSAAGCGSVRGTMLDRTPRCTAEANSCAATHRRFGTSLEPFSAIRGCSPAQVIVLI